jgi:transposase
LKLFNDSLCRDFLTTEAMMTKDTDGVKKYVVHLSAEERTALEGRIRKGKGAARHVLKARILLKADVSDAGEGWSDGDIIAALDTNKSTIYRVRKQLVEEGFEAVFQRKQRATPPTERIFDGAKEARLIQLACSAPPAGRARWTLQLLEDRIVTLGIEASDSTIGRVLKKTNVSLTAKSNGLSRQRKTRPS